MTPKETSDLIGFLFTLNYFDPPGSIPAGRLQFKEKKCIVCHQVGKTGGVLAPSLDFLKGYSSPIFMAAAFWNHGPSMAKAMQARGIERPVFKNSELRDLMAYLKSASKVGGEEAIHVLPGEAEKGRRLFVHKRCVECHNIDGLEGQVGGSLGKRRLKKTLTQFAAAIWNKVPAMVSAIRERDIPVFQLRAEEMSNIVAYLYSVQYFAGGGDAEKGRALLMQKGCLECHSLEGQGGNVARDFAKVKGLDSPARVIAALWKYSFTMEPLVETRKIAWPQFTSEEMSDLVTFLQTLGRGQ
jgi:cytochrome c2